MNEEIGGGYAIVINVPAGGETDCLICRPHAEEFDAVSNAVESAARTMRLAPALSLSQPLGLEFAREIALKTRSARLVVAICSPDTSHGRAGPNPNVMMEVGEAIALGKPILLMTSDARALPADLSGISALEYSVPVTRDLTARVLTEMTKILQPEIRPRTEGIWHARARHRMLLNAEFWSQFGPLFGRANELRKQADGLCRDFAHRLQEDANNISDSNGTDLRVAVTAFRERWRVYENRRDAIGPRLTAFPQRAAEWRELERVARESGAENELGPIRNYWSLVERSISAVGTSAVTVNGVLGGAAESGVVEGIAVDLASGITGCADALKRLQLYSDSLVDRMVDLVATGFEPAPQRRVAAA